MTLSQDGIHSHLRHLTNCNPILQWDCFTPPTNDSEDICALLRGIPEFSVPWPSGWLSSNYSSDYFYKDTKNYLLIKRIIVSVFRFILLIILDSFPVIYRIEFKLFSIESSFSIVFIWTFSMFFNFSSCFDK